MGHATNVYGIISGPNKDWVWTRNIEIIKALPELDTSFPPISRLMFNSSHGQDWDEHHMAFAANYKNLELEGGITIWKQKFEKLLRQLMWVSVTIHINTEISGNKVLEWTINQDLLQEWQQEHWVSTDLWTFKKKDG